MELLISLRIGIQRARRIGISPEVQPKYFFSSTGSDANDGLTDATPKQSLTALNSLVLAPGDIVGLKRGDSFNGSITIGYSGTSGNPIKFVPYGEGDKPKIYGSEVITGWTLHSGNIYKATFNTTIQQLFVNGEKMRVARLTNTGYNLITGVTSQTVFTTNAASQANNYYVGATVILRKQNYFSETRLVTASTGSTLTINTSSPTIEDGQSVLIMNKLAFLDAAGEWYYDTSTNTVYLWTPNGDTPANYEIRGSTINSGIAIHNGGAAPYPGRYVTIKDIDFLHQKVAGVKITGNAQVNDLVIENCNFDGQDQYGIYSLTSVISKNNWNNNTFTNINGNAIFAYNVTECSITNNTISNIGLMEKWGISNIQNDFGYNNNGTAIEVSTGDIAVPKIVNTIAYNKIYNVGYNGIMWRGEANINHNYIYGSGLSKSDGGAIYTGSATAANSVISYNIIDYVLGNKEGGTIDRNYGVGVYLDENSDSCTVENNTVVNVSDAGIFLHKPSNHIVRYNKTFDARYGFFTSNTGTGTSYITNNLIVTGKATDDYEPRQLVVREADSGTSLNNNIYVNGFTSDVVFRATDGTYKNFTDWKTFSSQDAASTYDGTDLGANETQRIIYNSSSTAKTFYLNAATSVKDENMDAISGSFVLQPFTGKYVRGLNLDCILDYEDSTAPTVTAFTIPATSESLEVEITTFTGSEGTTGYLITESATTPTLLTAGWSSTAPATFTASGGSSVTLYAWVRDAAGNISASASDATTLPDLTANLLANYYFTETSGTVSNDLIGTADGTIYGSPTMDGTKFTLDGVDDYVSFPLPTVLSSNQYNVDFSINIKFSILSTPSANKRLFYQGSSFTRGIIIVVDTNRDLLVVITENDGPVTVGRITNGGLIVGQIYNATVTWDAATNTIRLYLNGTEFTNTYDSNGLNGNSSGMRIGSSVNAGFINADVYELSLFDKKLDATEVGQWINR